MSVPALALKDATLRRGDRTLWANLTMEVEPGELVAVLGPNGGGKTSLLRVLLGRLALASGSAFVAGAPVGSSRSVGLVPQHGNAQAPAIRVRDLVLLGLTGHRWGASPRSADSRRRVEAALQAVGALDCADAPLPRLSGGERQRVRMAQALIGDPDLLLCDEPLASLDHHHQRSVAALVDEQRRRRQTAVLFVTHEINPVLPFVDRVLYLAGGGHRLGTPAEILCSECLSDLHGAPVEVLRSRHGVAILGAAS